MKLLSSRSALAALALSYAVQALEVTIVADTNRDGTVDTQGDTDLEGRAEWTDGRGAIFLANIGDTDRRCSKEITEETPEPDVDSCNDASDNIQRNSRYLAPAFTLPISDLAGGAVGSISVVEAAAAEKVRIFQKSGDDWTFIASNHTFTAEELTAGLDLGVDARDVRRPGVWDGRATLKFAVTSGEETAEDTVALRVAPVLTHHHLQAVQRVFTTEQVSPAHVKFNADLAQNAADAGILEPVFEFTMGDIWTQDFFETAYTSMPGPDGPIVLRIMIRSAQQQRPAGREVFTALRSATVGAVQVEESGGSIDSTGNLETIPPYELDGKSYPAGRIIQGAQYGELPKGFPFLQAQETQEPLGLDTNWLAVGHVDEFLQFLPADSERGWVLMADDPLAGIALLEKAVADGHGDDPALSRPVFDYDLSCLPTDTINQVLAKGNFTEGNEIAAQRIEGNLEILKRETGITDEEIFRVPALFYDQGWECDEEGARLASDNGLDSRETLVNIIDAALSSSTSRRLSSRQDDNYRLYAFYPGIVNGVVLNNTAVLAPNPWGPIIDGVDILAVAAEEAYAQASFDVTWQDDYFSHHWLMGEIHCGSNVWRDADALWW